MAKKYASEFPLPGGVERYFETLLRLLCRVRDNPCEHDELADWLRTEFELTSQSAAINAYIDLVKRMGLWTTKDGQLRLTPDGLTVVEQARTSESAAKRAVIDIKLRDVNGYDVLFSYLAGGERTFDELDDNLKQSLRVEWKSKNQTMFRVNWLRSLGYVAKDGRQYALTEAGEELTKGIPTIDPTLPDPPIEPPVPEQTDLMKRAIEIADRIDKAATEGGDGTELERATAAAFDLFGYVTQVIGGAGNPDVVASAQMGDASYRVLVETKSRSGGVVHQNDVSFPALREHKAMANADYSVVVGANFSGGNLEKWAKENCVRLMRADELRQLLLAHAVAVLPLDGLRELFAGGGSLDEGTLTQVLTESENTAQAMGLARQVYDAVREHQDQEGVLNAHSLFFILGGQYPIQSIDMTIGLLQSELIGAVGRSDKGSLHTRMAPRSLSDKLTQLSQVMSTDRA